MASELPSFETYLSIVHLKHRYCYRIDDGAYEEWIDLFTDDGVFGIEGQDRFEGRDELRRFATEVFDEEYAYTAHIVANPIISVDGDEATGRWYLYLPYARNDGATGWRQHRYADVYRRVDGEWRVAEAIVKPVASHTTEHQQF